MSALACGVDFGTSNSTVGWSRPGAASPLLPLEDGKPTLPSAVFFHAEDSRITYGRAAVADYLEGYEGRLMRALKSLLGTSLLEGQTEVQGRALPFRLLLSRFIGELKRRADAAAGQDFSHAVFGRPVFFVDDDAAADRLAQETLASIARDVGFRHVEFQYEPMAAAFDYESQLDGEECVLIVDIGGGTSDFSLVRLSPDRAGRVDRRDDILAHGGVHIGGTDFDKYLNLRSAMPHLGLGSRLASGKDMPSTPYMHLASWHTINQVYARKSVALLTDLHRESAEPRKTARLLELVEQRAGHWLAFQVETAKIALANAPVTRLDLAVLEAGLGADISRADLDAAIGALVDRIEQTIASLLAQAGVAADRIHTVFFTGGSSSVPLLRQRIGQRLPGARAVQGDIFGSIGTGLALDAARKFR